MTYDEFGNIVPDSPLDPGVTAPPAAVPGAESSWGAALFAWLNPEQVQREYAAVGKMPPTVEDIRASAVADVQNITAANVQKFFTTGQYIIVGAGILAVLYAVHEFTKGRR